MWNSFNTADYSGMIAETICIPGFNGEKIHAYYSRPIGEGPFPGIVLIPHGPGWDEFSRETARRFTEHGYSVLCPNIYERFGHGTPKEVITRVRAQGGVPDDTAMGDTAGSLNFLHSQPNANGKVGVIGMCSGGRHAFLAACTMEGIDASVNCWGGDVNNTPPERQSPLRPVEPIEYAQDLSCPLLGVFGSDDPGPSLKDVADLGEVLDKYGKKYEFLCYEDAGHAFWCYDQEKYRYKQCMDAWEKTVAFFDKYLKIDKGG